jgi:hypothetical protein
MKSTKVEAIGATLERDPELSSDLRLTGLHNKIGIAIAALRGFGTRLKKCPAGTIIEG